MHACLRLWMKECIVMVFMPDGQSEGIKSEVVYKILVARRLVMEVFTKWTTFTVWVKFISGVEFSLYTPAITLLWPWCSR